MNKIDQLFDAAKMLIRQTEASFSYSQFGYLQEVPFQRLWVDTHYDTPIETTCDRWKARGWAFLALIEGCFRAVISSIAMVYNRCCGDSSIAAKKHEYVMKQQCTGLKYALCAIWDPNGTKDQIRNNRAQYAQTPAFGYKKGSNPWGTPYDGTLTIDFCTVNHPWHIKPDQPYPWTQ